MLSLVVGCAAASTVAMVAGSVLTWSERWMVRRRAHGVEPPRVAVPGAEVATTEQHQGPHRKLRLPALRRRSPTELDALAHRCMVSVAHAVRGGDSLTAALVRTVDHEPALGVWFGGVVHRCDRGSTLAEALSSTPADRWPPAMAFTHRVLLLASHDATTAHGAQRVLHVGATILADWRDIRAERRAQSSQARASAMVLTWLPVAVATLMCAVDPRVRDVVIGSPLGAACLAGGLTCTAAGHVWIRRAISAPDRRRPRRHRASAQLAIPELIEAVAVNVAAGLPPLSILSHTTWPLPEALTPMLDDVRRRLRSGEPFAEAVLALRDHLGLDAAPLVDLLVAADRDGTALEPLLQGLSGQARRQRRRDAEAEARRLPVRLTAPLVLCALPGFVLLAIVPLVAGTLSSLALP